ASGSNNINDTVDLPLGATITYTATGTLSASATGTLSNTANATVPAGQVDSNPANNSDTDTDSIVSQADLAVTKGDNPDPVRAGMNLTYTITVSNTGPSDANAVQLSDMVPTNTTFVSL